MQMPSGNTAGFVTSVTNAKGQTSHAKYYACTGLPASATDANGKISTTTYDVLDRVSSVVAPDGGTRSLCYSDEVSGGCYSASVLSTTETDTLDSSISAVKRILRDGLGRVKQTQLLSDPDGVDYVDETYDAMGRKSQVSNPYRSGDTERWTTTHYDAIGRVNQVDQPDGSTSFTTYSGNFTTVQDEAGKKRKSETDGLGRLIAVWEDPGGLNYETDYSYDVFSDMTQAVQKGGAMSASWRTRTFTYDSLGELRCSANPEIGSPSASPATRMAEIKSAWCRRNFRLVSM
jgi:YD repeat-containing protein